MAVKKTLVLLVLLLLIGGGAAVLARPVPAGTVLAGDYEHQVVRAYFDDPALIDTVAQWKEPWDVDLEAGYLLLDVTPVEYQWLLDLGFRVEVDLALTEEINTPRVPLPNQGGGIPGYPCYRTVEETFASAEDMAANYPMLATWTDIGDSWDKATSGGPEGYDMQVLRLTNQSIPGPKPVLYVFGALHAREYVTAESVTRFAEHMLENYGVDPDVTWLMDHHQLDLVLQANPDGRKMAETGLLWRKNTNNSDGCSTNYGVDLNRNFEFYWNQGGSSGVCSAETYRGSAAASEPETQALQNYAYTIFPDQRDDPITSAAPITTTGIFLDIHATGDVILWPWGFTSNPPPNGDGIVTLARKMGYYSGYDPEQSLYATSGTTKDFMYGEFGVPAYTIELGTSFFQSCGYYESNVWPNVLPLLIQAAKSTRYSYIVPAGPDSVNVALSSVAVVAGDPVDLTAIIDDTRYISDDQGTEPTQNIMAAEMYIDVPDWLPGAVPLPLNPVDGSFDETVEAVAGTIDTTGFNTGRYTLYVRGQDALGNWGAYTAIYLDVFDPAVAPYIEGYVTDDATGAPLAATITAGSFETTTDPATGFYQLQVISGTYDITAVAVDHAIQTVTIQVEDYQTLPQDFSLLPVCSAFADDIEMGQNGWTALQTWAITDEAANSPIHSWTDSPGGDYDNNWDRWLRSPLIDMTDYDHATLSFWHICDTQTAADYCIVDISTDGGVSWTEVARFDGPGSAWEQVILDVSALGQEPDARIRFRLNTDGAVTADGWYVDDVQLMGNGPLCVFEEPPTAGFTVSADHVAVGEVVQFTNNSTGDNLSFEWDFGDGSPLSNAENLTHAYQAPGRYTVTLTVTNSAGSGSFSLDVQVDARLYLPVLINE
jgi:hypothetical protein